MLPQVVNHMSPQSGAIIYEEPKLSGVFSRIRCKKMHLLSALLLSLVGGASVYVFAGPRFQAESILTLDFRLDDPISFQNGQKTDSTKADFTAPIVRTEMDILESPPILKRAAIQLALDKDPEFAGPLSGDPSNEGALTTAVEHVKEFREEAMLWLKSVVGLNREGVGSRSPIDIATQNVRRRLDVKNDGRSFTVRLSLWSSDPVKSAKILNAIIREYLAYQLESKQQRDANAAIWLEQRLESLQRDALKAGKAVQEYRNQTGLAQTKGLTIEAQRLTELNSQLVLARAAVMQAEARLRDVKQASSASGLPATSDVLGSPLIQRLQAQQSDLARRQSELASRFGPKHPQMMSLQSEIDRVSKRISEEVGNVIESLTRELSIQRNKEMALQQEIHTLQGSVSDDKEVELQRLVRNADASWQMYEQVLTRLKQISEKQEMQTTDVTVVSWASPPISAAFPGRGLLGGATFFVILASFLFLMLLAEHNNKRLRTLGEANRRTGARALGIVPELPRRSRNRPHEYVARFPASEYTIRLKTICQSLVDSGNRGHGSRVVVVTSSIMGEGKSTFSLSLAAFLAKCGQRVLLVDADHRRGRLSKMLGIPRDDTSSEAGFDSEGPAIEVDPVTNLHFIQLHNNNRSGWDINMTETIEDIIRSNRWKYDLVIIDTPPVLAMPDAVSIGSWADDVFLLIGWNRTPYHVVNSSLERMMAADLPLRGVLLTKVDMKQHSIYDNNPYYRTTRKYYAS